MRTKTDVAFELETIRRAEQGDSEAGRLALDMIACRLETAELDSPLFDYLASSIRAFLDEGIALGRALGVEEEKHRGGRPRKYEELEVAAVDLLLRDHASFKAEQAIDWLYKEFSIDRRTVQKIRKGYDSRRSSSEGDLMDAMDRELLLHNAGSIRKNLEGVLPQT